MQFGGDERAAAIQVGATLLFGMLIVSMAMYQATVVPDQNAEVEYNHNQEVQSQLQELRNAIVSVPGGGNGGSVTVDLGTRYPSRTLFVNPPAPSGSLRTVDTTNGSVNIAVDNAAASGETNDYWNGDERTFNTGAIVYEPRYSEYRNAPTTVYEQSVLYNRFDGANVSLSDQRIVDGRQINLVALNGSLSESSAGSKSVSARPVSASRNAVAVEADGSDPINITIPTRLDNETWTESLEPEYDSNGGNIVGQYYEPVAGEDYALLSIELKQSETYNLRMAKVGVGSGVTEETTDLYLTDVEGGGSVQTGSSQELTVEVRDRFNNPVSGETVNVSVSGSGTLDNGSRTAQAVTGTSGTDGRVRVTYQAPSSETNDTVEANISAAPDQDEQVEYTVEVESSGGGSGGSGGSNAYTITWNDPADNSSNSGAALTNCDDESCTWDVGTSGGDTIALDASANDNIDNVDVDFRVNDSSLASVDPSSTTNTANGRVWTDLTADNNGTVAVYVLSSGSSDRIDVTIENVPRSPLITAVEPDPQALDTNDDGEFVRVYFPSNTDTAGWTLVDDEGDTTNFPDTTLQGEIYFAKNETAFENEWGLADDRVYPLNTPLANGGDVIELRTDTGQLIDEFGYNGVQTSNSWTLPGIDNGEVAIRKTDGSGNYIDTNQSSDWEIQDESTFFGVTNQPPTASFTVSDSNPNTGETVTFDPSGSSDSDGTIEEYRWDFDGDGTVDRTTTSTTTVSYTYGDDGQYDAELTVEDNGGATGTTTESITVANRAPAPSFTYSPTRPIRGDPVSFNASGSSDPDGSVSAYEWDWDDDGTYETTSGTPTVTHTFTSPGTKTVTLRVTDDDGATRTTSEQVQVVGGRIGVTYVTSTSNNNQIRAVDKQGRITKFDAGADTVRVGPSDTDLDGDGLKEVTYITGSGYIKLIDRNNQTQTLLDSVSAKKGAITVDSWQGSGTEVFYANNNDDSGVYRKSLDDSGTGTKVADFGQSLQGVLGIGDVDGDDSDEIAVLTGSNYIGVVDQDGTTYIDKDQLTVANSNGPGVGPVGDFNGDGDDRIATIDGSNRLRLVECNYKTTGSGKNLRCNGGAGTSDETVTLTPFESAKKAPFGAANWTGDATPELIYAENANSPAELYYVEVTGADGVGAEEYLTDSDGSRIEPIITNGVGSTVSLRPPDVLLHTNG